MKSNNIFYVDKTFEFQDLCTCYRLYGTIEPPPQYAALHEKRRRLRQQKQGSMMQRHNEAKDTSSSPSTSPPMVLFVNLVKPDDDDDDFNETKHTDPWMSNAILLHQNIQQISQMLQTHGQSYTHQHIFDNSNSNEIMEEEEVTMFESSIASFLASTTGQVDELRQMLLVNTTNHITSTSEQIQTHKSGILTHLVSRLTSITEEFKSMQLQRNRKDLEMFHDPFKFVYHDPDVLEVNDNTMAMDDDPLGSGGFGNIPSVDDIGVQVSNEYMEMVEREEEEFQRIYSQDDDDGDELERILVEETLFTFPVDTSPREKAKESMKRMNDRNDSSSIGIQNNTMEQTQGSSLDQEMKVHPPMEQHQQPMFTPPNANPNPNRSTQLPQSSSYERPTTSDILQQEQVFLTNTLQNTKLDSVHTVESQMVQITSLLSQFSNLISEQQEEIQVIAETTKQSRKNVDDGREKLVEATERKKQSRHYFAWAIFIMGLLLLFFNAVLS